MQSGDMVENVSFHCACWVFIEPWKCVENTMRDRLVLTISIENTKKFNSLAEYHLSADIEFVCIKASSGYLRCICISFNIF